MIWIPSPEWEDRTAVVIGTGPSLSLTQIHDIALARIDDRCRVIAVNDASLLAWFADILFAADRKWWKARGDVKTFPGRRVGLQETYHDATFDLVQRSGSEGFDERSGFVRTHGNSGAMAVQIAAHLASARILLVGFDMQKTVARSHCFGKYESTDLDVHPNMGQWITEFRALASALRGRLFCATPGSALNFLPQVDLGHALWT